MNLLAKDIASKSGYADGVEELALKHLTRTWNEAIEQAYNKADKFSYEAGQQIKKLKK